jgi:hypothetical protein
MRQAGAVWRVRERGGQPEKPVSLYEQSILLGKIRALSRAAGHRLVASPEWRNGVVFLKLSPGTQPDGLVVFFAELLALDGVEEIEFR